MTPKPWFSGNDGGRLLYGTLADEAARAGDCDSGRGIAHGHGGYTHDGFDSQPPLYDLNYDKASNEGTGFGTGSGTGNFADLDRPFRPSANGDGVGWGRGTPAVPYALLSDWELP